MKKIVLALIIALPLASCANNNVKSNDDTDTMTEAVTGSTPDGQFVGGFSKPREITEEEMKLFNKATAGYSEMQLVPQTVCTQVVAGTNYKFFCDYKDGYNLGRCDVIIFKPLSGEPGVTKIELK